MLVVESCVESIRDLQGLVAGLGVDGGVFSEN